MKELEGEDVLVVGLGTSGQAAAVALAGIGARPVVVDRLAEPALGAALKSLEASGIEVRLGVDVPEDLNSFRAVVVSPGVPHRAPVLEKARELGKRVISELELGFRLLEGRTMVAITGTNGKTTTTRIAAAMLDRPGRRAIPSGNIGTPLVSLVGSVGAADVPVVEVSSFQLQNVERFHARVAVMLNLAPDHFDWHRDLYEYAKAKARIVENMLPEEFFVYNCEDPFCREVAAGAPGITIGFGLHRVEGASVWLRDGMIVTGGRLPASELLEVAGLNVPGAHNVQNMMAASAAALALGEDPERVREAAVAFEGLEHRCEPAGEVDGITFYNDSKATNPHATLHAVKAFPGRFALIMGGRNKGLEFSDLATELCELMEEGRLAGVILTGESAGDIGRTLEAACPGAAVSSIRLADDLAEAVSVAMETVERGDSILFSPACASFDMFEDYRDRGKAFKSVVRELAGGARSGGVP